MGEGWDWEENLLTEESKQKKREADWRIEQLRAQEERDRVRLRRGYFNIPFMLDSDVRLNFPHFRNSTPAPGMSIGIWGANRTVYICHNCGCFGYKLYGECHELFKCYSCRSRNLVLLKAGDISLIMRSTSVGTNMQDVFSRRRERLRRNRR